MLSSMFFQKKYLWWDVPVRPATDKDNRRRDVDKSGKQLNVLLAKVRSTFSLGSFLSVNGRLGGVAFHYRKIHCHKITATIQFRPRVGISHV